MTGDPRSTPPLGTGRRDAHDGADAAPSDSARPEAGLAAGAGPGAGEAAVPDAGGPGDAGRRSAPVLSLEARKAQRLRDREAARAARVAAGGVDEDLAQRIARAEARAAKQEARERRERAEAEAAAAPAAPARAGVGPALGGVRPEQALAARKATPPRGAEAAVPAPAAIPGDADLPPPREAPRPRREAAPAKGAPPAGAEAAAAMRRPAAAARPRARHWLVLASFLALVVLPTALAAWYMWTRAAPRFASTAAFSVRTEDTNSSLSMLGGLAALAGNSSSSDTDILYEFIRSQEIVELVDARLDLRAVWSKGDPGRDPLFVFQPPGTIEDLHDYWSRMVRVYNDGGTGLLDVEVQAFSPQDATAIAEAIFEESSTLINRLSDIAQDDATRFAEEELQGAVDRLKQARAALTRFRNETQIVDPATAVASQMGLLSSLEGQLAQTLIDLDLLRQTAPDGDPRIAQAEARVAVIEERMAAERAKLGLGSGAPRLAQGSEGAEGLAPAGGEAFADLVGQYESLAVDQEFASQAYTAALASYDSAVAESRRQSRYLAAHVQPTLAQRAEYPARLTNTLLTFAFTLLAWTIMTLAAYALRDRR